MVTKKVNDPKPQKVCIPRYHTLETFLAMSDILSTDRKETRKARLLKMRYLYPVVNISQCWLFNGFTF